MDQLTLLRRTRDDLAPPDPAALEAARARLVQRATRPARRPPRLALVAVAAALVAVVAAIGLWPGSTPPASAAVLLHRAARAVDDGPSPGPGQYLAVETREVAMDYLASSDGSPGGLAGGVLERTVSTTYVPHDRAGAWATRSWSEPHGRVYGGAEMQAYADRTYAQSAHADDPTVERALAGHFGNGELGGGRDDQPDLAVLPRDPDRLLSYLQHADPSSDMPGSTAIEEASALLRSGTVPRDLRAAMYDALARLPGVVVIDEQKALDGRTGTAIGVRTGSYLDAVVIDTSTGDYLGQYMVQTRAFAHVPAGTVVDQTSVRLSVVDDLPR